MPGQVVGKATITVRPETQVVAIDPHVGLAVDAVELNPDGPTPIGFGKHKRLAVPTNAARDKSGTGSRAFLLVRLPDTPVMRQPDRLPRHGGICRIGNSAQMKLLVIIEVERDSGE